MWSYLKSKVQAVYHHNKFVPNFHILELEPYIFFPTGYYFGRVSVSLYRGSEPTPPGVREEAS